MRKLSLSVFTLILLSFSSYSQNEKLLSFIEHYSDSILTTAQQPGMIISVTRNGEVIYEKAKGLANVDTKEPMDKTMRFRIGSLTKTFTTTVLLQLVDEKLITLDEPIDKFFPNVPNAKNITIRMLGDMTSGLNNYSENDEFNDSLKYHPLKLWRPEELIEISLRHGTYFPPGTDWHYSNTNTIMLGLIIEKLTGNTLENEIKKRIVDKLGMKQTDFPNVPEIAGFHPQGYDEDDATFVYPLIDVTEKYNPTWAWAAGAMVSTIEDLKIYLKALAEGTLLSKETQTQRFKWIDVQPGFRYGFGIFEAGNEYLGHNGSYPGYHNISVHSPRTGYTIIILYNTQSNRIPDNFLKAMLPMIEQ
ncbi:MAG: class A beta-lactamase-related serine hydrolase [Ignavibacteriae bacterium]|nr:MAG: class A beta-lactamase-related serine hydrolase [Ignavibacteriota bacterium]